VFVEEHAGVKTVVAHSRRRKNLLQAKSWTGTKTRDLLHKRKDTASVAGKEETVVNAKISELANLLSAA
jgi:hypothetical protein